MKPDQLSIARDARPGRLRLAMTCGIVLMVLFGPGLALAKPRKGSGKRCSRQM